MFGKPVYWGKHLLWFNAFNYILPWPARVAVFNWCFGVRYDWREHRMRPS